MGQRPGLVLGQRLQPVAPNPLAITNISILVVPNIPTTGMLILLILIILPATPFPLSPSIPHRSYSHTPFPLSPSISTPLLFPHAIPLIPAFHTTPIPAHHSPYPSIPHRSYSRTPFPLSPSIPHRSYSRAPFPLSPSIPHCSYSRTPFPLSQHSTPLLFPHASPLIPAFHTTPIPARHSPYPPAFHSTSYSSTPDTAHNPVAAPVEASAHPMLDGDSYLFAMASMASVKESRLLFIDFLLSLCLER